jgi:hypothetical protein
MHFNKVCLDGEVTEMKRLLMKSVFVVVAAIACMAVGQEKVAFAPSHPNETPARNASLGQAAIERAAAANKYAFVFFWKEKGPSTDRALAAVQAATAKWTESVNLVSVQATDLAEKSLVDQYGVDRAPLPMVLAIAPCGAITKACTGTFDENQLREAFVSRCTAECMKALQAKKLVLLCVQPKSTQTQPISLQTGVREFTADPQYVDSSKVINLNAADPAEAAFLKDLRVDAQTPASVTVLIAPPAAVVGTFTGDVTKDQLVAKLKSAQSGCCPGGKCGPGGCCPKK